MSTKQICLAGGCFWGVEAYFKKLPGVLSTEVGYANSDIEDPSYEDVCHGASSASEAVMITYDDSTISLPLMLKALFRIIDPTSLNKQGNDRGPQYRTGIYWVDPQDEAVIRKFIESETANYKKPIVVEAMQLQNFTDAEGYHQDYLDKNPFGYCHISLRDADKFISENFNA